MRLVTTAAGNAILAAVAASGCTYSADFNGARFACDTLTPCPDGVPCIDGYCQAAGPRDGSTGDQDGSPENHSDGGFEAGAVTWRSAAVGRVDKTLFDSLATSDTDSETGDLFVAFISTKPARVVATMSGLALDWQEVRQQCTGRSTAGLAMFWAIARTPTSGAVSASLEASPLESSAVLAVHRYAGADPDDPIGSASWANTNGHDLQAACAGGADTTRYSWSSLDTTAAGSVVVSGAHTANYPSHQPGTGYTERSDDQSGSTSTSAGVAVQERGVDQPTANIEVSGGWDNAPDWAVVAVEIRD